MASAYVTVNDTGQSEVLQLQECDQLAKVFCERVIVVTFGGLAGLAEAPAVVCDDSVSRIQQPRDLLLPGGAAQGIPVDQDHRFAGAVIFVVKLDVS